jgi:drug/metabolite transporter (DMT)-like permease
VTWFLFALLGTALFGLVALTDKYMLSVHFKDPLVYAWVTGVSGGGIAFVIHQGILVTGDLDVPSGWPLASLLLPGALLFLAGFSYMRALSNAPAPLVVAYSQLTPVFAFLLGFWVLSETLSLVQVFGLVLVIGSAVALALAKPKALEPPERKVARTALVVLGTALPLMVVSCMFRAVSDLLLKQQTDEAGVLVAYLVSREGILLTGLVLLVHPGLRRRIGRGLRSTTAGAWIRLAGVEVGAITSFYLLAVALNRGPLALVSVISSNVAVFTLAYAAFFGLALKMPNVPPIGVAWRRLGTCLAIMAIGTAALTSVF